MKPLLFLSLLGIIACDGYNKGYSSARGYAPDVFEVHRRYRPHGRYVPYAAGAYSYESDLQGYGAPHPHAPYHPDHCHWYYDNGNVRNPLDHGHMRLRCYPPHPY
eukprot:GHVR01023347.1.p1 GENE.GHVR01023347.1~~GHVR01023347.1.p1  ORF type:complete len:105 (+),score=7.57 GHVR01023347.1:104-418(+)